MEARDTARAPRRSALDALLAGVVDYAGLFPPASLPMGAVVENYLDYVTKSEHYALLGRLVVPASRLREFEAAAGEVMLPRWPWRLSAVGGADLATDWGEVRLFNERHRERFDAVVDAVEVKAASPDDVALIAAAVGGDFETYVEVAPGGTLGAMLEAVAANGLRAKIRTGGVTPDAIPAVADVARFVAACAERRLPFKATAGLHHPIRADHPLTYEADAPRGLMHGFLNVFVAAAFAWDGEPTDVVLEVLEERSASAFEFSDGGVRWGGRELTVDDLLEARRHFAVSFGSCSFDEPVEDLTALHLL